MIKKLALLLGISLLAWTLSAQETTVYTEAYEAYKRGVELYDLGTFGQAQGEFQHVITLLRPTNEEKSKLLKAKAELNYAKCAVALQQPDGEKLILDFIRNHSPDPLSAQALVEVAEYYYNSKDYEKALEFYDKVDPGSLGKTDRNEMRFRKGYALFVQKKFRRAKAEFKFIQDEKTEYYYPTNYYLGLCEYFEGNFEEATRKLRIVEKSTRYKRQVPYYITQIYFAQRRFNDVISYAESRLRDQGVSKQKEMNLLVGQAYFEKQNYKKALPYLEYYADRAGRLTEQEFYQLGLCQYEVKKYDDAARNLEELSNTDSKMGQHAMYMLGNSYLRLNKRKSAQAAFARAQRMTYDADLQEESLFNYAKLSYELKSDREALKALQRIPSDSKYYSEAQSLMGDIFLNSRDYKQALEIIEKIPNKTIEIQESYQKVAFYYGLQLLQQGNDNSAKDMFQKSLTYPIDPAIKAQTIYWQADLDHRAKNYDASIRKINNFLSLAGPLNGLPDESSLFTANYIQGYNYLKKETYTTAFNYFNESIKGIKRNKSFIRNTAVRDKVLGDATIRAGDCQFKRNRYRDAVLFYDEAIANRYSGFIYAIYQEAIIEGLRGRVTDKIIALERIPREFPNSEYADDALLELGASYQEIGQYNKAVAPLTNLVDNYRNKSDLVNSGLLSLGLITYNQGNTNRAINYYKRVFSNNPSPNEATVALTALEQIYVDDLGRPDDFFAFLETIPNYKVDNIAKDSINYRSAENQFENGNYQRAIQGYTEYIRKFPNGINIIRAHYNRGESHAVLRQYGEALRDYEYVVNKGQSQYFVKALEKGALIAYNYAEDFNKSFDLYNKLEGAALNADMRFEAQLGALRSAYRLNNTRAVNDYSNKVANNPNATDTQRATANFYLGKLAYDRRDFNSAKNSFESVVRLSDNEQTAEARYLIAEIYYNQRNLDRAQEICINANRESSAYPYWVAKSVLLLSDILKEKGDLYNARAALEALLENYNEDADLVRTAREKLNLINSQINNSSRVVNPAQNSFMERDDEGGNK